MRRTEANRPPDFSEIRLPLPLSRAALILCLLYSLFFPGCGQEQKSCPRALPESSAPSVDPVVVGHELFEHFGCVMCHGADANSGIRNPNAKTNEQIPPLIYVAEGYTPVELKQFILRGQPNIDKLNPSGPVPPYRMPGFAGLIDEPELDALQQYLFSLKPAGEEKF